MRKKYEIWISMVFLIGVLFISSCSGSGKSDEFGCFPSSCSLIRQENARKVCEDWMAGRFVWSGDCADAGSSACTSLCEQDKTRYSQGEKFVPAEGVMVFLPSEVDIYGRDWYTEEVDLPLTGTIYAWGPTLQTGTETIRWLKDRGAEIIYTGISIWNEDAWKTIDQLPEELKTAYVTGFDGEQLFIQEVVFLNFLDPAYQNWIKERIKESIDYGTNGFVFDEHWGTAQAVNFGEGPCDQFALEGFKQYLAEKYSASELEKKGISDLQTFNYCQYLVDNNLVSQYQENFRLVNFGSDYREYLYRASNAVIKDIIQFASNYAQEKGKQIVFAANYEPTDKLDEYDFVDALETFVFEHEWFPKWREEGEYVRFPAGVPVSPSMKYAYGRNVNAAAMYALNNKNDINIQGLQGETKLVLHQFAESYANRGYYMYFEVTDYLGLGFQTDREQLYPYYMFIRNEPQVFQDLEQNNNLAVVLPPHATVDNRYTNDALAVSLTLSEANIQHDVTDLEKIDEYQMVIATGFAWSDAEVEQLLQYLEAGGIVVSFDNRFASLDENFESVSRSDIQSLRRNGTHQYGSGEFIFYADNLGEKIWRNQLPEDKAKIISAVADMAIQNIAPANIQVLPYVSAEKLIVHILNYDFQNSDFIHMEDLPIKIHIPEGYSTEGKTMKIISPDFEGEVAVDFTIEGEMIVFTLPALYIWDIVIVE